MAATVEQASRYQFKAAHHSSHRLLLAEFPERGEGRRVLDVGCAIGYLSAVSYTHLDVYKRQEYGTTTPGVASPWAPGMALPSQA